MTRYTAPALRAVCVCHPDVGPFWLAYVSYAGHVFSVDGHYGSRSDALAAAGEAVDDVVRRCTPAYIARLEARSNEPSPGSRVVVVGGT